MNEYKQITGTLKINNPSPEVLQFWKDKEKADKEFIERIKNDMNRQLFGK